MRSRFVGTDGSNAIWGMQFVWPIKAEYLIAFLDADYTQTVIARSSRDYVWLMARTPTVSDADYDPIRHMLQALAAAQPDAAVTGTG